MSGIDEQPGVICPACKEVYYWACQISRTSHIWLLSDKYKEVEKAKYNYPYHVINNCRGIVELYELNAIQLVICKFCGARYESGHYMFDRVKRKMVYWIKKEMMS